MRLPLLISALCALSTGLAYAAPSLDVPINLVDAQGVSQAIGTVNISPSPYGLIFTPHLNGLAAGVHGFHLHQNASCAPGMNDGKTVAALAAGGHWDPSKTGRHEGPYSPDGHLGDLPAIYVTADGQASAPVLAPRLHDLDALKGHTLMIHAGGDNHSDHPAPLGGGGARVACGVIS